MSRIRTNVITNRMANGAPTVSNGLVISGVTTTSDVNVGQGVTFTQTGNATFTGIVTATSFVGSGANLTSLPSSQLTGALPAIDGSNLTGISGVTINNNADNRVITGSGSANTLNGESNVVIDAGGRLLFNTTTDGSPGGFSSKIQIRDITYTASLSLVRNDTGAGGPVVVFGKSRGNAIGDATVVQNNDILGRLDFYGADGTDLNSAGAYIGAKVDGTPGSNDMPSRIIFSTTSDGETSPTDRVEIKSGGGLVSSKGGSIAFSDGYSAIEARAPEGTTQLTVTNSTYEAGPTYDNEAGIWFKGNYSGNNERAKSAIIHKNIGDYGVGTLNFCVDNGYDNQNATYADRKMTITKDGYVTTPQQPSFAAYRNVDGYSLNGDDFSFNATLHNIGSHFNTSNYRFTAPVAGRYLFTFYSILNTQINNGVYSIRINGGGGYGQYVHFTTTNSSWDHVSTSWILNLSANDYVTMRSDSNIGWHGNSWQRFCGELLS